MKLNMKNKACWKSLGIVSLYTIGYLLLQILVSTAAGAVIGILVAGEGTATLETLQQTVTQRLLQAQAYISLIANVLAIGILWGISALRKRPFAQDLGLAPLPHALVVRCVALGMALGTAISLLLGFLPEKLLSDYAAQSEALLVGPLWLRVLSIAILAPLLEEMLFRGRIYDTLRAAMPRPWAIAIGSLLFGLLHGHPVWIAYAALLGAVMCLVRDACNSLWASVAFHMAVNAMGSFLLPNAPWAYNLLVLALALGAGVWLWRDLGLGKKDRRG